MATGSTPTEPRMPSAVEEVAEWEWQEEEEEEEEYETNEEDNDDDSDEEEEQEQENPAPKGEVPPRSDSFLADLEKLFAAVDENDPVGVKTLIEQHADPNAKSARDRSARLLLICASIARRMVC